MQNSNRFKDNPKRFRGRFGQLRLPAAKSWYPDRQWLHFLVGLLFGGVFLCGIFYNDLMLVPAIILTITFLVYEIMEGLEIHDFCYVDIGGFITGLSVIIIGGILYNIISAKLNLALWGITLF